MVLDQARDLTKSWVEFFEGDAKTHIPSDLLDHLINSAMQQHFAKTMDLYTYAQTLAIEGKQEYSLPSDCIAIERMEVGGDRHDPRRWDYVNDVIDGY